MLQGCVLEGMELTPTATRRSMTMVGYKASYSIARLCYSQWCFFFISWSEQPSRPEVQPKTKARGNDMQ